MVYVLKKNASKEDVLKLKRQLESISKQSGFDAQRFNGALPFSKDPLEFQKELRNEWDRNIGCYKHPVVPTIQKHF